MLFCVLSKIIIRFFYPLGRHRRLNRISSRFFFQFPPIFAIFFQILLFLLLFFRQNTCTFLNANISFFLPIYCSMSFTCSTAPQRLTFTFFLHFWKTGIIVSITQLKKMLQIYATAYLYTRRLKFQRHVCIYA